MLRRGTVAASVPMSCPTRPSSDLITFIAVVVPRPTLGLPMVRSAPILWASMPAWGGDMLLTTALRASVVPRFVGLLALLSVALIVSTVPRPALRVGMLRRAAVG